MPGSLVSLLGRRSHAASRREEPVSDDALMARCREGDRSAFEALFAAYRDPVWRFFRRRVADAGKAEELAQDTFVGMLSGASRYEGRGSCRSYVFGIAFNVLMDWRRRARPYEPLDVDTPASSPDPDTAIWVRAALSRLEPEEREILMLREYEQLSYQELADVLALPLNTVRSRLFRAREAMRLALAEPPKEASNHGLR
jgi:RNA polymerase sigma-70 factor (ECF subfamily)